jgi:hypothetical protein
MAKLSIHGEPAAEYFRRSTNPEDCEVAYRLMSDGVLLKQTVWSRTVKLRPNRRPYKSGWKIAKVTPEIKANSRRAGLVLRTSLRPSWTFVSERSVLRKVTVLPAADSMCQPCVCSYTYG